VAHLPWHRTRWSINSLWPGRPAHVIERIRIAQGLGINHFELFLIGPDKMRTIQRFAAEVMPAFR